LTRTERDGILLRLPVPERPELAPRAQELDAEHPGD
jgi:hypothetical protein